MTPLRLIIGFLLLVSSFELSAQQENKISFAAEIGFPIGSTSENLSLLAHVEPKMNLSDHVRLGIRIACVINSQTFEEHNRRRYTFANQFDHGFLSTIPTIEYFWTKQKFGPFLGVGVGPYLLGNSVDVVTIGERTNSDVSQVRVDYEFGAMIRAGIEWRKMRIGMEYNFIPQSTLETVTGEKIGTVTSSYLGVSAGYVFGKAS